MTFSNKLYDQLRFVALVLLPALGTLYFGVAEIWGLPYAQEVVGTLVVIDTALGVLLRQARKKYEEADEAFDGYLNQQGEDPDTGLPNLKMVVTKHPREIISGRVARFKVGSPPQQEN